MLPRRPLSRLVLVAMHLVRRLKQRYLAAAAAGGAGGGDVVFPGAASRLLELR